MVELENYLQSSLATYDTENEIMGKIRRNLGKNKDNKTCVVYYSFKKMKDIYYNVTNHIRIYNIVIL